MWALEWVWHSAESNVRCAWIHICMPNSNIVAFKVSEVTEFIRIEGYTDMARSTRLVILIKNISTLWDSETYFPMNLVYLVTLRVARIKVGAYVSMSNLWPDVVVSSCCLNAFIFSSFLVFLTWMTVRINMIRS